MNPVPWLQMTNMISYQGLVRTFLSYRRWLHTAELNETKLIAYNCPKCLEKLQTTEAPEGETWDTFSNCPFCGSLLFKVTQGATVKIDLILNIGVKPDGKHKAAKPYAG